MIKLSQFKQLKSAQGTHYFVSELSGVMVCLAPTGERDAHGNPLWNLIAKDPKTVIRGRSAEMLNGGCVLVRLASTAPPAATPTPRRARKRVAK